MKAIGIICEYNPFHNGHLYHIKKIKSLYPDYIIILILNGYFLERGEISLLSKEDKIKIALENSIDLVLELPFIFGCQSADTFANGALKILNEFKIEKLIFGSEINDPTIINSIAKKQINNSEFNNKIKEYLNEGVNYPTAIAKALNVDFKYQPNDLLGISYAKSILQNNYPIIIETIKRTNNYYDISLDNSVVSATNIREKIKNHQDITKYLPNNVIKYINNIDYGKLFKLIKYKIITDENLNLYLDVEEGIEYKIRKAIYIAKDYNNLIELIKSKRYTYNKINRMLIHILVGLTKIDMTNANLEYINILGFNTKGQKYLNTIKKEIKIPLVKNFNSIEYKYEIKSSLIYDLITNSKSYDYEKKNKPSK